MRKSIVTLIALTLSCISLYAGEIKVHPIPQQIQGGNQTVQVKEIRLIGGEKADPEAVKKLQELFKITTDSKAYPVYIGEKGDKAVKKYNSRIPAKDGGYYLNIGDKQMIIAGHEGRGTFYALQTLSQLLKQQELPVVEIVDYPSVPYRGTVEPPRPDQPIEFLRSQQAEHVYLRPKRRSLPQQSQLAAALPGKRSRTNQGIGGNR